MSRLQDYIKKAFLLLDYMILVVGAITDLWYIQLFAFAIFFLYVAISNVRVGMALVMAMIPNIAVMSLSSTGLLGLAFAVILIKVSANSHYGIHVKPVVLIILAYLLILTTTRLVNSNYYDLALMLQVAIVVITWTSLLKKTTSDDALLFIDYFRFGCLLMSLGMLVSYPLEAESIGRLKAVQDDCNYTGAVMCVLLAVSLLTYCYKLPLKHNLFYMIVALIMGLATGSRGFMLSTAIILMLLLLTKSFGKKTAKIVILGLFLMAVIYGLYLYGFSPIVSIYNNTIGRTVELQETHMEGNFMDVTSGRSILWAYYLAEAIEDNTVFLWGRGFYNYFLEANGGFGLAAHNMYISSIIGVGIIATVLILLMYFSILKTYFLKRQKIINIAFSSIIIALLINYFFLDGMLEIRLITYHAMVALMMNIYKNKSLLLTSNGKNSSVIKC